MGNTLQTPQQQEEEEDDEREPLLPPQPQNPNQDENLTCQICTEPILSPNKKFKNENRCTHPLCTDCIIKYITVEFERHEDVARIRCPFLDCTHYLDPISCRTILSEQFFITWCDKLCKSTLLDLETCRCPYENCSEIVINECGGNVNKSQCPNCKRLFCFKCKLPWHAGFGCEESGENRDPNDAAFAELVEENKWQSCPRCRRVVELASGCSNIKCRCGIYFCYRCGRQVDDRGCGCALDAAGNGPGRLHRLCVVFLCFCVIGFMSWAIVELHMLFDN